MVCERNDRKEKKSNCFGRFEWISVNAVLHLALRAEVTALVSVHFANEMVGARLDVLEMLSEAYLLNLLGQGSS